MMIMMNTMMMIMIHACIGEMGNSCNTLVGKPEGKRPHGRFRRRWEDNIRNDVREIGCIWLRTGTGTGLLGTW
jgi:hypothetical protein